MDKYKKHGVEIGKGWERENRKHFDEIVEKFDRARWDYTNELYEDIYKYFNNNKKNKKNNSNNIPKIALEIGAGTGIATKHFLDAGFEITAIELGANMAAFMREKFKSYKNLHCR